MALADVTYIKRGTPQWWDCKSIVSHKVVPQQEQILTISMSISVWYYQNLMLFLWLQCEDTVQNHQHQFHTHCDINNTTSDVQFAGDMIIYTATSIFAVVVQKSQIFKKIPANSKLNQCAWVLVSKCNTL